MPKSKAILNFLQQPRAYPPTVREIGAAVGLSSSSTVHYYLKKLEGQGLIERLPKSPRCITVKGYDE